MRLFQLVKDRTAEAILRRLSEFALINQAPRALLSLEAPLLVSWWRRSRVELYRERGLIVLLAA
jgi:hypothetical protein